MKMNFCGGFKLFFKTFCALVVILMITFWMYKYYSDEDLCLVDYKIVQDLQGESLPVLSVCFYNPFIDEKFNKINANWNGTYYTDYLRGSVSEEKFQNLDYNSLTLNFTDYIVTIDVHYRNGSSKTFSSPNDQSIVQHYNTFSGFWYGGSFISCFGTSVNNDYKKVVHFVQVNYKRDQFLDNTFVEKGNTFTTFHYPKQFLLAPLNINNFWLDSNRTVNKIVYYTIDNVELLLKRNKRREPCSYSSTNFDDFVIGKHIKKIGCRPPYLSKYNEYPVCTSREDMKSSANIAYARYSKIYHKPCQAMPKVNFANTDEPTWKNDMSFGIGIAYPEHFKIISQYQAVDFHSLVGNIGGYIGLFLGNIVIDLTM